MQVEPIWILVRGSVWIVLIIVMFAQLLNVMSVRQTIINIREVVWRNVRFPIILKIRNVSNAHLHVQNAPASLPALNVMTGFNCTKENVR